MPQRRDSDRHKQLVARLCQQDQATLVETVRQLWTAKGWAVEQLDEQWLRVSSAGNTRRLCVTTSGVEAQFRERVEAQQPPVTLVTTATELNAPMSWARRDDETTVLDASDVVRLCDREAISDDIFGPFYDGQSDIAGLMAMMRLPFHAGLTAFAIAWFDSPAPSLSGSITGTVLRTAAITILCVHLVAITDSSSDRDGMRWRLARAGSTIGALAYLVGSFGLGAPMTGLVVPVAVAGLTFVGTAALVGVDNLLSLRLFAYFVPMDDREY